jgi:uncharacterized membrane protein YidH (DUF202 family)
MKDVLQTFETQKIVRIFVIILPQSHFLFQTMALLFCLFTDGLIALHFLRYSKQYNQQSRHFNRNSCTIFSQ